MRHENTKPSKQEQLKHQELHLGLDFWNLSSQWLFSWREGDLVQAIHVPEENIYKNLGTSNNNEGVWYEYYFTTRRSSDVTNILSLSLSSPPFYMGVKPGLSQEGNTILWGCPIIGSSRRYLGLREDKGRSNRGLDRTAQSVTCLCSETAFCVASLLTNYTEQERSWEATTSSSRPATPPPPVPTNLWNTKDQYLYTRANISLCSEPDKSSQHPTMPI
jgi:hypothetical protein